MKYNNNDNDLYAYFEVINQIEPRSCIDFGPFLKLCGCVARQVKNMEIDENIELVAVDCCPNDNLKIYGTIYNEQISLDEVMSGDRKYELVMGIGIETSVNSSRIEAIIHWISGHCRYFFTDMNLAQMNLNNFRVKNIQIDDNKYFIYFMEG